MTTKKDSSFTVRPDSVTTSERDLLSPEDGRIIWNKTTKMLENYNGTDWTPLALTPEQQATLMFFMYNPTDDLLDALKTIRVPAASIDIEELITLSELTGFLGLSNNVTLNTFSILDARFDNTGSFRPNNFFLTEAENNLVLQSDFSTPITSTNFTFNFTTTQLAQTNKIHLMTANAVNNVSVEIVDTTSGVAFKFLPTKLAFDTDEDGLNLGTGDVIIDLGISPMRFAPGRQLTITIKSDNTGFLGNASGVPWLSVDLQRAEFRGLAWVFELDNVIHDNVPDEIVSIEEKTAPVGDDEALIEDSEDDNNKKSVKLKNLPQTQHPQESDTISGTEDNYSLSNIVNTGSIRFSLSGGDVELTGIVAPSPEFPKCLTIINASTGNALKLQFDDGGSSASNRILTPDNNEIVIPRNGALMIMYDTTSNRWRVIANV